MEGINKMAFEKTKEKNSRTGLKNTVVIAKRINPRCNQEVQAKEEIALGICGDISYPVCGGQMVGEIN